MEFLVRIDVDLPPEMPFGERRLLLEAEGVRGRELIADGTIVRIWRIPGRQSNFSLYSAEDATAVHEAITSLPLWPWMNVHVEALAKHPLEGGAQ